MYSYSDHILRQWFLNQTILGFFLMNYILTSKTMNIINIFNQVTNLNFVQVSFFFFLVKKET